MTEKYIQYDALEDLFDECLKQVKFGWAKQDAKQFDHVHFVQIAHTIIEAVLRKNGYDMVTYAAMLGSQIQHLLGDLKKEE